MLITSYGNVYTMLFTTKLHKHITTRKCSNCTGCSYLKLYHLVLNTAKCTVRMKLDYLPLERARKRLNNCDATVILRLEANVLGIRNFEIWWNLNILEICFFLHRIQQSLKIFIFDTCISATRRLMSLSSSCTFLLCIFWYLACIGW